MNLLFIVLFLSCKDNSLSNDEDDNAGWIIDSPTYPCPYADVSVSPDGNKLIFMHSTITYFSRSGYRVDFDPESIGIWTCNIDGTELNQIYKNNKDIVSNPQFTPSMDEVVFVKNAQICLAKITGGVIKEENIVQLTNQARNFFPSVSPTGEWIAYDSNNDSPNGMYFIWKMKIDGTEKTRIAYSSEEGEMREPYWSLDNKIYHIRFTREQGTNPEIYIMDDNGDNVDRITNDNLWINYPSVSFDDKYLALNSQDRSQRGSLLYPQISIVDLTTNKVSLLTTEGIYGNCSWTKANKIVYVSYAPFNYDVNNGTIWIMDKDGSNKKQLTYNSEMKLDQ